jgi:hypothetical protein
VIERTVEIVPSGLCTTGLCARSMLPGLSIPSGIRFAERKPMSGCGLGGGGGNLVEEAGAICGGGFTRGS